MPSETLLADDDVEETLKGNPKPHTPGHNVTRGDVDTWQKCTDGLAGRIISCLGGRADAKAARPTPAVLLVCRPTELCFNILAFTATAFESNMDSR